MKARVALDERVMNAYEGHGMHVFCCVLQIPEKSTTSNRMYSFRRSMID